MKIQIYLIVIPFLLVAAGCGKTKDNPHHYILDKAERLLVHHADSAEILLESLPDPDNLPDRDFARWCMLSGKATNHTHADARTTRQWERATEWLDKNGSTAEGIQAHLFLGRAYAGDGDFDKAMKTYAEALDHAKTCQEYNLAGYICTYMADIYRETFLMQKVKDKYAEAASLFSKAGNHKSQAYALKNLALEYVITDSIKAAHRFMGQADSIARKLDIQRLNYAIANAYTGIYEHEKQYDKAEEYCKKAMALDTRGGRQDSFGLAFIYLAQRKTAEAKKLTDRLAEKENPKDYSINDLYYGIFKSEGDYKTALRFKETAMETLDSIYHRQMEMRVLETEKKYNHLKTLEKNARLENDRQRLSIYAILSTCLLTIAGLSLIFYRKHTAMRLRWREEELNTMEKEQKETARLLAEAENELKNMQGGREDMIRQQQKIISLTEQFRRMQKQHMETSAICKKLATLANKKQPGKDRCLLTEKLWEQLAEETDRIYPDLQPLLLRHFDNLSEDEQRYCRLHILGFDGNEEAVLLGIAPSSVWMKRSRIKQKLDTSSPKSLYEILTGGLTENTTV